MRVVIALLICLGLIVPSIARADTDRLIQPDSAYSPEQVIEIQLFGLQASKDDITAIEQVWVFAHPDNKRATGPLDRFARLFTYPAYAPMVGHKGYSYELLAKDDRTVRFRVDLRGRDGNGYSYIWDLRKTLADDVTSEVKEGWWMTTGVTAPRKSDAL